MGMAEEENMTNEEAPEKEPSILLCAVVIALVSLVCILWVFQDVEIPEDGGVGRCVPTSSGRVFCFSEEPEPVRVEPELVAT